MVNYQTSRAEIHSALQQELQTPSFQRKFNRFKKLHKQFRQFGTAKELVEFFHLPNPLNPLTKNRLLHRLVSDYQKNPKRKSWLMTLLLVISWKQMGCTFYRFGFEQLNLINPSDPFAPVYESFVDSFLDVKRKSSRKFSLHLKDHAEYLIRKEIKECNRFTGDPEDNILAAENLPWQFEIEQLIEEWTNKGILNNWQSELVIYRIVYEYTFKELERKFKTPSTTLRQQLHRAINRLKPYLKAKYFMGD